MPYPTLPDGSTLTLCPECHVSMENIDPQGHAMKHYPERIDRQDPRTRQARRRQALLRSAHIDVPPPAAEDDEEV